jgi:hypothetical protein
MILSLHRSRDTSRTVFERDEITALAIAYYLPTLPDATSWRAAEFRFVTTGTIA